MLVAKVIDNAIVELSDYRAMFPNTSFSAAGPDTEFMTANGLMPVEMAATFNPLTHRAENVTPFIDGSVVRTQIAVPLTAGEITARETLRIQGKIKSFQDEAGRRLDNFAIARGYGSIISVCTYDTSSVPRYAADALRARSLRDQWWEVLNQIVNDVLSAQRPEPEKFDDIAGELPPLTWS